MTNSRRLLVESRLSPALRRVGASNDLLDQLHRPELLRKRAVAPAREEPYGRKPILRTGLAELLLICWDEDVFCAPHDHGEATGLIYLCEGRYTERTYAWHGRELRIVRKRQVESPAVLEVQAGLIHDMKASGGGLGLHLYEPAISRMQVYDLARRQVLVVGDDSGAWLPRDPRMVVERRSFPSPKAEAR